MRVGLRGPELRNGGIRALLKKLCVVVTWRFKFTVAVIELQRTLPFLIEIQPALYRQRSNGVNRKRRIIAVFDGDVDLGSRTRIKIRIQVLRGNRLAATVYTHAANSAPLEFVAVLIGPNDGSIEVHAARRN